VHKLLLRKAGISVSDGATETAPALIGPGLVHRGARRARLSLPRARPWKLALLFAAITWVPLAIFAALEGHFASPGWSFGRDVAMYTRLLWAGPLLLATSSYTDRELASGVEAWRTAELISPESCAKFDRFLARVQAIRRSSLPEVALVVLAYALTAVGLHRRAADLTETWMFVPGSHGELSGAGWWYALVSAPLLAHMFLRWLWRFGVWTVALARLTTLPPAVLGTHPDEVGGLDGVTRLHNMFVWLALGLSSIAAGGLANLIIHTEADANFLRRTAILVAVLLLAIFLLPLMLFTPRLILGKRRTLARYGAVAAHHAQHLEERVDHALEADQRAHPRLSDELLEADANLAQSFATVRAMRIILIDRSNLMLFGVASAGPLLLIELARMPASELLAALKSAFM
jgi:hypothetical protein